MEAFLPMLMLRHVYQRRQDVSRGGAPHSNPVASAADDGRGTEPRHLLTPNVPALLKSPLGAFVAGNKNKQILAVYISSIILAALATHIQSFAAPWHV